MRVDLVLQVLSKQRGLTPLEIFVQFVHEDLNSYCHSFISLDKLDSIVGNKKMNEKDLQFESNKEGVNVKIGELSWSDKNDCLYDKEGVSQYPECPSALNEEYSFANLDSIPMQDISLVVKASMYATNDELKEYSKCVMVDTENIVATDGHWMFYKKSHKREDSILIPLSVIPILDEKSEYEVY